MRNLRGAARKRRLAVLQVQAAETAGLGTEPVKYAGDIQSFSVACGAKPPLRFRVVDERNGHHSEVVVAKPYATIGSAELCDVRLLHPDVSRHHAYVQVLGGRALCCDLGSRTGTHWGRSTHSRQWLPPAGSPVYIGPFAVSLAAPEPSPEASTISVGSRTARMDSLKMLLSFMNARSRSGRTRISRVRNPVTLAGWSHLCNLRLQHHSVGRVHCSLVWAESGLWVVDLLCAGGTLVNGVPVSYARLDDDDTLTLGRFQLKIAYGSSSELPLQEITEAGALVADANSEVQRVESEPATNATNGELSAPPAAEIIPAPLQLPALPAIIAGDLTAPGAADSIAVTLMQQFATMQQQLFDHTQQVLSAMAETFHAAHVRQMEVIREELSRVHELNRELQELNRQRSGGAPVGRGLSLRAGGSTQSHAPPPAPVSEREPPTALAAGVRPSAPENSRLPAAEDDRARNPSAPGSGGQDIHAWLTNRISELEQERSGRWQRILQLLTQGRS
ncbi:MAG: FHA domain-containing protein [Planctomycetaceae bacterium]